MRISKALFLCLMTAAFNVNAQQASDKKLYSMSIAELRAQGYDCPITSMGNCGPGNVPFDVRPVLEDDLRKRGVHLVDGQRQPSAAHAVLSITIDQFEVARASATCIGTFTLESPSIPAKEQKRKIREPVRLQGMPRDRNAFPIPPEQEDRELVDLRVSDCLLAVSDDIAALFEKYAKP